eukprot:10619283-Alexandrium_andersonii.AAC.1
MVAGLCMPSESESTSSHNRETSSSAAAKAAASAGSINWPSASCNQCSLRSARPNGPSRANQSS